MRANAGPQAALPAAELVRRLASAATGQATSSAAVLGALAMGCVGMMVGFAVIDRAIRNDLAPHGIISMEFAATPAKGSAMVSGWSPAQREWVAFALGLDFLFMPLYSTTIWFACELAVAVVSQRNAPLGKLGRVVGRSQYVAAGLDVVENLALLAGLRFPSAKAVSAAFPVAAVCATVKFCLILLGLGFAGLGAAQHHYGEAMPNLPELPVELAGVPPKPHHRTRRRASSVRTPDSAGGHTVKPRRRSSSSRDLLADPPAVHRPRRRSSSARKIKSHEDYI
mmetsp:Transcript_14980/g.47665  ORF Transcript_14980/g.47665 Transcript_14980/m.47665 type:complete len:282 (+) Transcript_14980:57-902(+)